MQIRVQKNRSHVKILTAAKYSCSVIILSGWTRENDEINEDVNRNENILPFGFIFSKVTKL